LPLLRLRFRAVLLLRFVAIPDDRRKANASDSAFGGSSRILR
jgi:hypothetical protein